MTQARTLSLNKHMADSRSRTGLGSLGDVVVQLPEWQGDGPPHWKECKGKQTERPCKSASEAMRLRDLTVGRLHRCGGIEAEVLAERLAACAPDTPCASGACPICSRCLQRWFVHESRRLVAALPGRLQVYMVSLIPDFGACAWDQTGGFDLAAIKRRATRALVTAGVKVAFGGVDFSMNVDECSDRPYLQAQLLLFIPDLTGLQKNALVKQLNRSGSVKVPVQAQKFDGDNAGLAYALKYVFFRRESYLQQPHVRVDRRDTLNTRSRPLRGQAAAQLAIMLDRLGLNSRLIMVGVKRIRKNGKVRMVVIE